MGAVKMVGGADHPVVDRLGLLAPETPGMLHEILEFGKECAIGRDGIDDAD
ncbi:hypothetical protein Q427_27500 [Halomonas sp. BC04]|nr:hypothetical protein Q427_27500 [Halomonas sp. BC04]